MNSFVGGEFWSEECFQTDHITIPKQRITFLNGGEAAMRLLCDYLQAQDIHHLLIPAYICSTMADAFDRYGIRYTFYQVGSDFRVDLDDLIRRSAGFRALYIINYFGFGFSSAEIDVFRQLKQSGMLLIEDDAQAGFNRACIADVCFNTLRKMVPHDGSFFYSDLDFSSSLLKFQNIPNNRLPVIRSFRNTFARLLAEGAETFEELNPLFEESERCYYSDLTVLGDAAELSVAERLDWSRIETIRKNNHRRLVERLQDLSEIEIIFHSPSANSLPLGFPIYIKSGPRDALLDYLREHNIYPVVHWNILQDPRLNQNRMAAGISAKIMTLILDQRFDLEDMDYQAEMVRAFYRK